jgi:hypothetical protein
MEFNPMTLHQEEMYFGRIARLIQSFYQSRPELPQFSTLNDQLATRATNRAFMVDIEIYRAFPNYCPILLNAESLATSCIALGNFKYPLPDEYWIKGKIVAVTCAGKDFSNLLDWVIHVQVTDLEALDTLLIKAPTNDHAYPYHVVGINLISPKPLILGPRKAKYTCNIKYDIDALKLPLLIEIFLCLAHQKMDIATENVDLMVDYMCVPNPKYYHPD